MPRMRRSPSTASPKSRAGAIASTSSPPGVNPSPPPKPRPDRSERMVSSMPNIASRAEWLEARKELLDKEKALTRLHDHLAAERRKLPWVRIDKPYVFETESGKA